MSFFTSYKNYILLAIAFIIAGLVVFERMGDRFSRKPDSPPETLLVSPQPSESGTPIISPDGTLSPVGSAPPPLYRGRDPEEVLPAAGEVKLFSEEQKQEIYRAIGNHGKGVNENPDYFNGWIQVGLLKKVIGDFEGASDAWEYAGLIRPQNSVSFSNLGELYWRYLRDYPKSEANFKISLANKPDDAAT